MAHQAAVTTARNLRNRLTRHLEEGDRSQSRFNRGTGQKRSNLIRLIDILRRNDPPSIIRLTNIKATRLGIRLPSCPVAIDQQALVSEQESPVRPQEKIRVSCNSSLVASVNSDPDLQSLETFKNQLAVLEQKAARGPIYAEVLQVEPPPNQVADLWCAWHL